MAFLRLKPPDISFFKNIHMLTHCMKYSLTTSVHCVTEWFLLNDVIKYPEAEITFMCTQCIRQCKRFDSSLTTAVNDDVSHQSPDGKTVLFLSSSGCGPNGLGKPCGGRAVFCRRYFKFWRTIYSESMFIGSMRLFVIKWHTELGLLLNFFAYHPPTPFLSRYNISNLNAMRV